MDNHLVRLNSSNAANQNFNKNCLQKKKNKEREKRKRWDQRENNKKEGTLEILATKSNT